MRDNVNSAFAFAHEQLMAKQYTMTVVRDVDGWLVSEVVELPGCHTQAKTMDELVKRTKEAIRGYVKAADNIDLATEFIGLHKIRA